MQASGRQSRGVGDTLALCQLSMFAPSVTRGKRLVVADSLVSAGERMRPGLASRRTPMWATCKQSTCKGSDRQAELMRQLGQRQGANAPKDQMIERMIQALQEGKHALD
jgi:hypothetical protein